MPERKMEHTILNAIQGKQHFSFVELKERTGLNLTELFPLIEQLVQDGKVTLSVSVNAEANYVHQSRYEYLYTRFLDWVTTHLAEDRSVKFYASMLCISPKYLSVVVRHVCGKTPTLLIKEKVMDEIKYKLCCTQETIKEIAYGLNFPNLSFSNILRGKSASPPPLTVQYTQKRTANKY